MKENLIEKGNLIIKELKLEDAKITSKWMAHYIAELIEKYQSTNNDKKKDIGNECAKLILELWKIKLKEKKLELERNIGKKLIILNDNIEISYPILNKTLNKPENVENLNNDEKIELLQSIYEVENLLIEFYKLSITLSKKTDKEKIYSPTEIAIYNHNRDQIAAVFPFFKDLAIENQKTIEENIFSALGSLNYLRTLIFFNQESNSKVNKDLNKDFLDNEDTELMERFKKETGKNAIWRGKLTKAYITWEKNRIYKDIEF